MTPLWSWCWEDRIWSVRPCTHERCIDREWGTGRVTRRTEFHPTGEPTTAEIYAAGITPPANPQ